MYKKQKLNKTASKSKNLNLSKWVSYMVTEFVKNVIY